MGRRGKPSKDKERLRCDQNCGPVSMLTLGIKSCRSRDRIELGLNNIN